MLGADHTTIPWTPVRNPSAHPARAAPWATHQLGQTLSRQYQPCTQPDHPQRDLPPILARYNCFHSHGFSVPLSIRQSFFINSIALVYLAANFIEYSAHGNVILQYP